MAKICEQKIVIKISFESINGKLIICYERSNCLSVSTRMTLCFCVCFGVDCVYKCVKITGAKSLKHKAKNEHKMCKYLNTKTIGIIKAQLGTHACTQTHIYTYLHTHMDKTNFTNHTVIALL